MNEKDWNLLVHLYEEQNITKTAKKLYISQPSLTYRIKQIESEFKVNVVYRGNKGVIFTNEGELLVQYAKEMLIKLRQTKDRISNVDDDLRGTLRLGASSNFALYQLPSLLEGFIDKHLNVEIELKTGWSTEILGYLNNDNIHVGIVRGNKIWKGEKSLINEERLHVVSKNEIKLEDLPELNYIKYKTDSDLKNTFDDWWRNKFESPPKISMEVDRIETCKELVKRGIGYSLMPGISLREEDKLNTIELEIDNKPVIRKTWLLYRKDLLELNMVDSLISFIKDFYHKE